MKKMISFVIVLLVLITYPTNTVFAGTALELIEVRNNSAGPTFIFRVAGDFTKPELSDGIVNVSGGELYALHCGAEQNGNIVVCHATKKVGGHNVVIEFGNARFWTYVPAPNICYTIWDWLIPPAPDAWTDFGQYCSEYEAQVGDTLEYYNEYSDAYETVTFFEVYTPLVGTCAALGYPSNNEPAYYYPECP